MFDIKSNLAKLPDKPGVYLHKDKYGEIIYVGKAASLKSRVRQYFAPPAGLDPKTRVLASHIAEFEFIVTNTEAEALLLENTLIKRHRPRYNVMLLDDKTYPYIRITKGERFPRILKTRILKGDGSKYFGPYADVGALNRIISLLNDVYRLKRCGREDFPAGWRPCLHGFIGNCDRPCAGEVDPLEYAKRIAAASDFLRGKSRGLIFFLTERMKDAAARMDFEDAAKWRDLIGSADAVTERQKVDLLSSGNMDILIATEAAEGQMAQVSVFFVRDGRLVGREIHRLDAAEGSAKTEIVSAFLKQYYANQTMLPKEILLEEHIEDEGAIADYLAAAAIDAGPEGGDRTEGDGSFVPKGGTNEPSPSVPLRITAPLRGKKRDLLRLAQHDVEESSKLRNDVLAARREKETDALQGLLAVIGGAGGGAENGNTDEPSPCVEPSPFVLRIEAYDISHTGGTGSVGAMVVFRGAEKSRRDYRRFRIRSEGGADDYGAMQEVLYRRFRRGLAGEKGFDELPGVLLVDGGKGHVSAAEQVLSAMKVRVPVLGMVKDDRHRTRGLIARGEETDLTDLPNLYHLIGTIQEEVHRFAVEYHRGVRGKSAVKSELDGIPGVGEKRRNALFIRFGGIAAIKDASAEELAAVPGMNAKTAAAIVDYFKKK
ncbi:MAG: excinuclease ABC subunit UvrC [Clostridiales Family XIII bacterium]|jgi:excinuclease ABC subunit C|nr:excinuclease ABC subunit UvrC [Clostridiales Family XIII bacterium]